MNTNTNPTAYARIAERIARANARALGAASLAARAARRESSALADESLKLRTQAAKAAYKSAQERAYAAEDAEFSAACDAEESARSARAAKKRAARWRAWRDEAAAGMTRADVRAAMRGMARMSAAVLDGRAENLAAAKRLLGGRPCALAAILFAARGEMHMGSPASLSYMVVREWPDGSMSSC